jgi:hypothetical protein
MLRDRKINKGKQNDRVVAMMNLEGLQDPRTSCASVSLSDEAWLFACQTAGIGVAEWDLQTEQICWSVEMELLYGLAPGTFAGTWTAFEQYVHPEDLPLVRQTLEQAIRQGSGYQLEFQIVNPAGEVSRLHSTGKIVQRQGRSWLLEGVRSVLEQPDVSDLGIEQEIQWRRWMGCSRDVFFRLLSPDVILFVSNAIESEFGHLPLTLAGQSFLLNVHRAEHSQLRSALQQLYRFGSPVSLEFHYWHHSGRWVKVEGYGCRLDEADSECVFFIRNLSRYSGAIDFETPR